MKDKLKQGMNKFKQASKNQIDKLPKPVQAKADKEIGLFMHKYVATLFLFDDDIQEIYRDMETAVENNNKDKALQLSQEMKFVINKKADPNSGYFDRRVEKRINKVSKKLGKQADKIEDLGKQVSPRKLVEVLRKGRGKDPEDLEDLDIDKLKDEVNEK